MLNYLYANITSFAFGKCYNLYNEDEEIDQKRHMDYTQTVKYLYNLLPAYQRQGATAFKKDLTNIKILCASLGDPQDQYPTIHVGGTNGKGTVSHILASILMECGMTVGLYTSPHYMDFRERIKINGVYISEARVVDFVERHDELIRVVEPSFFEMTVAMAFDHFQQEKVDVAVIEVGLGGRLDSTNIITPCISVITNIGMDHMDMLGDTIPQIAFEKAGIIKEGIPVVIGEYAQDSAEVFDAKAEEMSSNISYASEIWEVEAENDSIRLSAIDTEKAVVLRLTHQGPFTTVNVRTAVEVMHRSIQLNIFPNLDQPAIIRGIERFRENTRYQGRWQKLRSKPDVIADSGHNAHALKRSIDYLQTLGYTSIHFVLGFSKGKDIEEMLRMFPNSEKYYLSRPDLFRGLDVNDLSAIAEEIGLDYERYISLSSAYQAALRCAGEDDLVFIGGSSFVVGELLPLF